MYERGPSSRQVTMKPEGFFDRLTFTNESRFVWYMRRVSKVVTTENRPPTFTERYATYFFSFFFLKKIRLL